MARVVDGGFAYRASEMITRAALLSTSQMLENSVPNPSVLVISLQQSEKSRECIVKIQDSELLHADRDPRTVLVIHANLSPNQSRPPPGPDVSPGPDGPDKRNCTVAKFSVSIKN